MPSLRGTSSLITALTLLGGVPPAAAQSPVLSGQVRVRSEYGDPAGGDADGFTLLRTRVGVEARPLEYARVFAQIQDSRVFGEELSTLGDASADQLDLHQGYVELFTDVSGHGLRLRVGRQEIALADERLVGAVDWSNTGRSLDGARLDVRGPGGWWNVTWFLTTIRDVDQPPAGDGDHGGSVGPDEVFGGIHATFPDYDVFVFQGLNGASAAGTNIDRTTLGGRVHRSMGRLDYEVTGAYQLGKLEPLARGASVPVRTDIAAWMAAGRLDVRVSETGPLTGLGAGLDWLSGDEDGLFNRRGDHRVFDVLFHTGHKWYGFMDLFLNPAARTSGRGLVDALATVRTRWAGRVPVTATLHRFSLAEDAGLRDSELGWEVDVTAPYALGDAGSVQAGYSAFFAGDAAPEVGLASADETRHWVYLQLQMSF